MYVMLGYFDTGPLVRLVCSRVQNPLERDRKIGQKVDGLLTGASSTFALSEYTLLELQSNVATMCRGDGINKPPFDIQWGRAAMREVMTLLGSGGPLQVIPPPGNVAERAMALVESATREYGLALRAWDAVHIITAANWGIDNGEAVRLYTTDRDFTRFIGRFRQFGDYVSVIYLDDS